MIYLQSSFSFFILFFVCFQVSVGEMGEAIWQREQDMKLAIKYFHRSF